MSWCCSPSHVRQSNSVVPVMRSLNTHHHFLMVLQVDGNPTLCCVSCTVTRKPDHVVLVLQECRSPASFWTGLSGTQKPKDPFVHVPNFNMPDTDIKKTCTIFCSPKFKVHKCSNLIVNQSYKYTSSPASFFTVFQLHKSQAAFCHSLTCRHKPSTILRQLSNIEKPYNILYLSYRYIYSIQHKALLSPSLNHT